MQASRRGCGYIREIIVATGDYAQDRVSCEMAIVASYGMINDPGYSPSTAMVMNAPYSAYVIGDYTGITPPF